MLEPAVALSGGAGRPGSGLEIKSGTMGEDYIHGFTAAEMQRLTRMQDILNEAELALLDLGGVGRLLDVGSGLGQMTRAFARRLAPVSTVGGVERDARQLAEAARQAEMAGEAGLVEFRCGDATALPLTPPERGSFDLAHARFLLEHVRDPLAVVRQMVAAVRPSGRVVLLDDDHELLRLWPECQQADRVCSIYWQSYRARGFDPLIGRRLADLLKWAGAAPIRITTVFYGVTRGLVRRAHRQESGARTGERAEAATRPARRDFSELREYRCDSPSSRGSSLASCCLSWRPSGGDRATGP